MLTTPKSMGSISRSERVKRTWQNPDRRAEQTRAMKKCWQREDYRTRLTNHLRKIALKGAQRSAELRSSGAVKFSDESRRHWSTSQSGQVLEVLGCYFHSCPAHFPEVKRPRSASPAYKESVYKRNGYEVIFIWEHDIKPRKLAFADSGVKDPWIYAKP